eukprot:1188692-Prorocentrum_minimum.AAC.3
MESVTRPCGISSSAPALHIGSTDDVLWGFWFTVWSFGVDADGLFGPVASFEASREASSLFGR